MKHYDYVEWLLYKNKALPEDKQTEMEEHLYSCDICMNIFLSLIDEKDMEAAESIIPIDFTQNTIKNISKSKVKKLEQKTSKKSIPYQLGYYVAVASVTIVLTMGGFYTGLVDSVPRITASVETFEIKSNVVANISEQIVNSTQGLLFSIENMDRIKEEK